MADETVVIPNDGSPPGHIEKMLGRKPAEGDQTDDQTGDQTGDQVAARPDDVPEKFWDAEKGEINTAALLKAQADGETALRAAQSGEPKTELKPGDEGYVAPEGDQQVTEKQAPVVEDASKEWAEKGELSEETFKSLEGVGLSRDMVNTYIAGQQAIVTNLQTAAYEPFEGSEGYAKATEWASANLSEDEISALNVQLTSTNPAIVAQGAKALAKTYTENADVEPSLLRGNGNGNANGDTYSSRAEMMRDMASPKYRTDSGFRNEVKEKLRRSKL
jgi:hypothetical protein